MDNCQVDLKCRYIAENPIQSSCQPDCIAPKVWNGSACVDSTIGACGTANGKTYPQNAIGYGADTQCARGEASLIFFPAPGDTARWVCRGRNGGDDSIECSATRQGTGMCGTATKTYDWDKTSFGTDTFCREGSPVGSVSFPQPGQTVSWTCPARDGLPNTTCFANRGLQPICGTNDSRGLPDDSFPADRLEFPIGSGYCRIGTASDTPSFPGLGETVDWACSTGNGPDASCEAKRGLVVDGCPANTSYVDASTKSDKCCTPDEITNKLFKCDE